MQIHSDVLIRAKVCIYFHLHSAVSQQNIHGNNYEGKFILNAAIIEILLLLKRICISTLSHNNVCAACNKSNSWSGMSYEDLCLLCISTGRGYQGPCQFQNITTLNNRATKSSQFKAVRLRTDCHLLPSGPFVAQHHRA